jgi:hypothetical protein
MPTTVRMFESRWRLSVRYHLHTLWAALIQSEIQARSVHFWMHRLAAQPVAARSVKIWTYLLTPPVGKQRHPVEVVAPLPCAM